MKKLLHILFIIAFLTSCSQDKLSIDNIPNEFDTIIELSEQEFLSISLDSPKELTEDNAADILSNFILSERNGSPTRSDSAPSIRLIDKKVLRTGDEFAATRSSMTEKEIQTSIYEFKVSDGTNEGIALVSGDERSPALIAYVPEFDEGTVSMSGAQIMFDIARASHLSDIVDIENIKDSLRDKTFTKISEKLNIPVDEVSYEVIKDNIRVTGGSYTRVDPVTNPPSRVYSFVYPLISTKWDQGEPYNCMHPDIVIDLLTGETGKPRAGCVAVALAQVFAYCHIPFSIGQGPAINWNLLLGNPKISTSASLSTRTLIGSVMFEIFQQTRGYYMYGTDYRHNGTFTSSGSWLSYMSQFMTAPIFQQPYDWTIVQDSLNDFCPVMIAGQGHCWILDGYALCQRGTSGGSFYDTYVTTNFGWGGRNDGYYKLNADFSVNFLDQFNTANPNAVINIIPYCEWW